MRIMTVVGARPQFIKAAAVSRALRAAPGFAEVLVHTGQHYDENMSAIFFEELGVPTPDHRLEVGSAGHGAQTGRMLEAVERLLIADRPDCVLVYGDTNSTLAGALAAVKLHVPVSHVEAGLRSFNRRMPEEINRVLADHASDLLFAPTPSAVRNLGREGISAGKVHLVGDVMYDAALHYARQAAALARLPRALGLTPGSYVLATVHRAENTDDPARLGAVLLGLERVARQVPVVLPLHPRTRSAWARSGRSLPAGEGLLIIDPVGYLEMISLEKNARLVVTDSGGVQKEAYFYGVACVTLREETEWQELLEIGANQLLPPSDPDAVAAGILGALETAGPAPAAGLYGDGRTAERIVAILGGEV